MLITRKLKIEKVLIELTEEEARKLSFDLGALVSCRSWPLFTFIQELQKLLEV